MTRDLNWPRSLAPDAPPAYPCCRGLRHAQRAETVPPCSLPDHHRGSEKAPGNLVGRTGRKTTAKLRGCVAAMLTRADTHARGDLQRRH